MKRLTLAIIALQAAFTLASCASVGSTAPTAPTAPSAAEPVKGPVVFGRETGSEMSMWIPYSNVSGESKPVIATEGYVATHPAAQNPLFTVPVNMTRTDGAPMLTLAEYLTGDHSNAPKTLTASQYLSIGSREYGSNSYRTIGFGYRALASDSSPVAIGMQERTQSGSTYGDFVVATRTKTSGDVDVTFRVTYDGHPQTTSSYVPSLPYDLVTKAYVDKHVLPASRPSSPAVGSIYFETSKAKIEIWDGTIWRYADGTPVIGQ